MKQLILMMLIGFHTVLMARAVSAAEGEIAYEHMVLENGMEVVLVPNHKVPAVSHMVWYKVGSADEEEGNTGLAHLFEHLMFKATDNLRSGEFSEMVAKAGGSDNAFTSYDYTGYYQNIARDTLETVMRMEADRMTNLILNDEQIAREKLVVLEERRSRIENNPFALLVEKMNEAVFGEHPYARPVIGFSSDVQSATQEEIQAFYRTYYAPNNAILVVVGDMTMAALKPLAEKYYGVIPASDALPERTIPKVARPLSPKQVTHTDANVKKTQWLRFYVAPQYHASCRECHALTLLSYLLGEARTSILYERLVVKEELATSVSAHYDDMMIGPSKFVISATPAPNISLDMLEAKIALVLDEVASQPFLKDELERAKNLMSAQVIYAQEDFKTMANIFGTVYATGFDGEYINQWEDNMRAVTAEDIQQIAAQLFSNTHYVTGYLRPKQEGANE